MDPTSLELRRMRAGLDALEQAIRHLRIQVTRLRSGEVSSSELEAISESVGHLEQLVARAQGPAEGSAHATAE